MPCKRCEGLTKDGSRCKNKVSCDQSCRAFCWIHSKGYQSGENEVCTFPKARRPRANAVTKKKPVKKRVTKKKPVKKTK